MPNKLFVGGEYKSDQGRHRIFKLAYQIKCANKDIVGGKQVKDENWNPALTEHGKPKVWNSHYSNMLFVEFPLDDTSLDKRLPLECSTIHFTEDLLSNAIWKIKSEKAAGSWEVLIKAVILGGVTFICLTFKQGQKTTGWMKPLYIYQHF